MDLTAVRRKIADAASGVSVTPGLTCLPYPPGQFQPPLFAAWEIEVNYDQTMARGVDTLDVTCRVLVSSVNDQVACEAVDALLKGSGPTSLKAAIEAVRRHNGGDLVSSGVAHDWHVRRFNGHRWFDHNGGNFFGGDLTMRVIGGGD